MGFHGLHWQADSFPLAPTEKPGDPGVKNPPATQEMWVWFLGREDLLEKEMATHSSILAWRIPIDQGAWRATGHGISESQTRLSR